MSQQQSILHAAADKVDVQERLAHDRARGTPAVPLTESTRTPLNSGTINTGSEAAKAARIHRHCIGSGFTPYCHKDELVVHQVLTPAELDEWISSRQLDLHPTHRDFVKLPQQASGKLPPLIRVSNWIWWPPVSNYVRYLGALLLATFFVAQLKPGGMLTLIFRPDAFFQNLGQYLDANGDDKRLPASPDAFNKSLLAEIENSGNAEETRTPGFRVVTWPRLFKREWQIAITIVAWTTLIVPPAWFLTLRVRCWLMASYVALYDNGSRDLRKLKNSTRFLKKLLITLVVEGLAPGVVFLFMFLYLKPQFHIAPDIVLILGSIALLVAAFASWVFVSPPAMAESLFPIRAASLYAVILGFALLALRVLEEVGDPRASTDVYPDLAIIGHLVVLAVIWMASPKWLRRLSPLSEV